MTLGERLRAARKNRGYTQRELAAMIGAKHNSVSNWEKGLNQPDPATIEKICRLLNVTPNDLLAGGDNSAAEGLSGVERAFLEKYRLLDEAARGAVDALLAYYHGVAAGASPNLRPAPPRPPVSAAPAELYELVAGRISRQSVAAGTGTWLGPEDFAPISLRRNALTGRADFLVPVSGDSMEPRFFDGDILMVERGPVQPGEIGIFTLGGKGYVKKRGKGELVSLNPGYEPIPMDESILCNGRVIGVLNPEWIVDCGDPPSPE